MTRAPHRHQRRPRRRLIASAAALVGLLAPAAAGAGITIRNLDTSGAPTIRVTVVTQTPVRQAPHVLEDGATVAGLTAVNLGSDKNIVLAVDHSQSMYGRSLTDAARAARRFIALGHARDHFAIVTFASQTTVLAGFGSGGVAAGASGGLAVDPRYGTTLYDACPRPARRRRTAAGCSSSSATVRRRPAAPPSSARSSRPPCASPLIRSPSSRRASLPPAGAPRLETGGTYPARARAPF
jgi:hypothetical protein